MDVELIKMDKDEARDKLRAYRKAIAERHHSAAARAATSEYEAIEHAYRSLARGLSLIDLPKAMATGGWDEQGRPRFAVARADLRQVSGYVGQDEIRFNARGYKRRLADFRFPLRGMPPRPTTANKWWSGRAIVPLVPPDVLTRPDMDLSRRVTLWEANWTEAPVDPLLLFPIGGDLYAVEGAWDLTPLERSIIAGTRRP